MKKSLPIAVLLIITFSLMGCSSATVVSTESTTTTTTESVEPSDDSTTTTASTTTTLPITVWQTVRYEQNAPGLSYSGAWTRSSSGSASKGSFVYADSSGSSVTFEFVGTHCALLAKTSNQYGKAKVTVDEESTSTVDFYSKDTVWRHVVWETKTLPFGTHTVKIAWTGKKSAGAKDTFINVDAIEIVGAIVARYRQNDERFDYSGKWKTVKNESASGGSFALTKSSGASVTVNFTGTQIDWFAKVGPAYGKAQVTVDGGVPIMVDLYSGDELWRQRVWTSGRMDVGPHTVKIKWTGTKNPESTDTYINVDGFEIAGFLE
jgi:hypothetical protein